MNGTVTSVCGWNCHICNAAHTYHMRSARQIAGNKSAYRSKIALVNFVKFVENCRFTTPKAYSLGWVKMNEIRCKRFFLCYYYRVTRYYYRWDKIYANCNQGKMLSIMCRQTYLGHEINFISPVTYSWQVLHFQKPIQCDNFKND